MGASTKFTLQTVEVKHSLRIRLPAVCSRISTRMGNRLCAGKQSWYVTSHPGQLSLVIPPWIIGGISSSLWATAWRPCVADWRSWCSCLSTVFESLSGEHWTIYSSPEQVISELWVLLTFNIPYVTLMWSHCYGSQNADLVIEKKIYAQNTQNGLKVINTLDNA